MRKALAVAGDLAVPVDACNAGSSLKEKNPRLLKDGETVEMAFQGRGGAGRDSTYFTSNRILVRNVKGVTGKSVLFESIPYQSIQAYSVETAGKVDTSCSFRVWSKGRGLTTVNFYSSEVDVLAILQYLNGKVLLHGAHVTESLTASDAPSGHGWAGNVLDWLGGDSRQIDPKQVEKHLKQETKVLVENEDVSLAFKLGRDSFVFTSKRLLLIDVNGLSGKSVEFKTILWNVVKFFSIETAGRFDRDAELTLYTSIGRLEIDLRKGQVDVMAVQKYFADKFLGQDVASSVGASAQPSPTATQGEPNTAANLFSWMGDDSRMVDAAEMNSTYHTNPPILQHTEFVEMAFKGRRDLMLFTTKRLVFVDLKGFSAKKIKYVSVPWKNVMAFGVRSAGSFMDKDSEMMVWTDVDDIYYPPKNGDNDPPPEPRMSYLEIDFRKDRVDIMAIHRYLSERCIRNDFGELKPSTLRVDQSMMQAEPGRAEALIDWLGQNARQIPASEAYAKLSRGARVLQNGEDVGIAYQFGRDMIVLTQRRLLSIDTQGWSGKTVAWVSIPWQSVRAYSVQCAGSWDLDAEVKLWCKIYWMVGAPGSTFAFDLRKGKSDVVGLHNYISTCTLGTTSGSGDASLPPPLETPVQVDPAAVTSFLEWIGDAGRELDPAEMNKVLHSSPCLLQENEHVERVYKCGRDVFAYTTQRLLAIDVKGWSGKKVEYESYPLHHCVEFDVKSAGCISSLDATCARVYTDIPGDRGTIIQNLAEGKSDIWDVQDHFLTKFL